MKPLQLIHWVVTVSTFNFLLISNVFGQQIVFSDSLGSYANINFSSIAGKINQTIIVTESLPDNPPRIFLFDTACSLIKSKQLSFIPPGGYLKTTVFEDSNSWNILWQSINGGYWYLHKTYLSGDDTVIRQSEIIDSSLLPASIKLHPYFVEESALHQYQLLFNKIPDYENNQLLINLIVIAAETGKVDKGQLVIPFKKDLDINQEVFIDDNGNVFTAVYDQPLNYKLNSNIRLYKYKLNGGQFNFTPLYAKGKKPVNIRILFDRADSSIQLMSLYADFNSRNINGIMSATVSATDKAKPELYFYTFPNDLKKELSRKIANVPTNQLMNYLELKQVLKSNNNKTTTVLLELWYNTHQPYDISSLLTKDNAPKTDYTYYSPYNSLNGGTQLQPGLPKIPIAHVSFIATFDNHFNMAHQKILQTEVTADYEYIAPLNIINNDSLSHFYYEGRAAKIRLNSSESSLFSDSLHKQTLLIKPHILLLFNHAAVFKKERFLFTFYHNQQTNGYGLAKLNW